MNTTQSKTQVPARASTFLITARLVAALLLPALLVPSAFAQSQYIYVANSGDDTVSKIDITTDTEVARYATWFTPSDPLYGTYPEHGLAGPAPSRIARDTAGYFYVLNRFFPENVPGGTIVSPPMHLPVLVKIGPFGGVLGSTTSNGPTNVLQMHDADGDRQIDPGEAADVRILWGKDIGTQTTVGNPGDEGALGRALCMDPSGYLWVGLHNKKKYYKVDPANGNPVGPAVSTNNHMPYGCQVDTQGRLWSVDYSHDAYPGHTLAEIDTVTHQLKAIHDHGPNNPPSKGRSYSLSLFNGCGSGPTKVYISEWESRRTYIAYDPLTNSFSNPPLPAAQQFNSIAVGVDQSGNIISGQYKDGALGGRVIKTTPAGAVVWDTATTLGAGPTVFTQDLHGIIIDRDSNVWAVDRDANQVIKYRGSDGKQLAIVGVGASPYTYGNPPAPTCPCAVTSEPQIKCEKKDKDGNWLYSWSFVVTNNSPFSIPATTVDISAPTGSPITILTPPGNPAQFTFPSPGLPPKGQATVTGTFTLAQPIPGSEICLDIRLNAGVGWCCPLEHVCFTVPDCACASLQGQFKCNHGQKFLELSVTNLGPTAATGAQIFSNTPGLTVSPASTTLAFPQNTPVLVTPLSVTGATPGQVISLSVMLHGPIDPKTGVNSWCCTATVKVTYPAKLCWWVPDGDIFDDLNANGVRDSGENGLAEWTVTLTGAKGTPRTTKSDASGHYNFEEVEPGKYRVSLQPPRGWRMTAPKGSVHSLSAEAPPTGKLDFGFVKTR